MRSRTAAIFGIFGAFLGISAAGATGGGCSSGALSVGRIDVQAEPSSLDGGLDGGDANAEAAVDAGVCDAPRALRHYTFDGTGTDVVDVRGGASGRLLGGATLDGSGVVRLDGVDDYVDLPNGIVSTLPEATIAVWVRRLGGAGYTRIFDFGTGSLGEDPDDAASTVGRSYIAATPSTGFVPSGLAVLMTQSGSAGEAVATSDTFLPQELRFVTVVVSRETLSLFYEGALLTRVPRTVPLATIVDDNAWIGRSQYSADPYFEAEIADFRIFDVALADCAVRALHAQGSSPPP